MIYIRTDGNAQIGMGHLMRCLTIADQIRRHREQVTFILSDKSCVEIMEKKKYSYVLLQSDYDKLEEEIPKILAYLEATYAKRILIDSYYATQSYLQAIHEKCWVAFIDDMHLFEAPVDLVLNYNLYANDLHYQPSDTKKYLLGCEYAPLREEFAKNVLGKAENGKSILVTTGGSDSENIAARFLHSALKPESMISDSYFHVVSGAFNPNLAELEQIATENNNVYLHVDVQNMAELMKVCGIALTAGGSTMYELCAMGVPMVCFSFAENQNRLVAKAEEVGIAVSIGNYQEKGDDLIMDAVQAINALSADKKRREKMQETQIGLTDGNGADRIASELVE